MFQTTFFQSHFEKVTVQKSIVELFTKLVILNLTFTCMENYPLKQEYRFLMKSSRIENTIFLYKTALSKANVAKIKMGSKKRTYYQKRSFASD